MIITRVSDRKYLLQGEGWTGHATLRERPKNQRDMDRRTRVYGVLEAFAKPELAALEANTETHVYSEDEHQPWAIEHMRSYRALKRALLRVGNPRARAIVAEVHDALAGYRATDPGARFSINAGCFACPCSPGYVADRRIYMNDRIVDVYVDAN